MTRRRVRARKSRSSDSSLRGGLPLARVRLRRIGLSWTEPLCVSAIRLRSLAQELRSSSPGALGKGARRHEVCRRRYHCPVPGCPLNRSRRCTRSRVPPSASLCSRSCGCHFPLRRCALGARLVGTSGPSLRSCSAIWAFKRGALAVGFGIYSLRAAIILAA